MKKALSITLTLLWLACAITNAERKAPANGMYPDRLYDFEYTLGPIGAMVKYLKPADGYADTLEILKITSPGILEHSDLLVGDRIAGIGGKKFKRSEQAVFAPVLT